MVEIEFGMIFNVWWIALLVERDSSYKNGAKYIEVRKHKNDDAED